MSKRGRKEYAVELYSKKDDSFIEQIDVYNSFNEAKTKMHEFEKDDNFKIELETNYFGILCIEYDENDDEINAYRITD